jgi:hypothetical protein
MRPDLDDYEELNTDEGAPRGRNISWLVLGVAVLGFGALAYYAYQSGSKSAADGQLVMVEAETGAIKEAPADPGGEQFPHKDKTIYDALSPYRTDDEQPVEKLLPEPEEPVIPEPAVNTPVVDKKAETTTFVNDGAKGKAAPEVEPEAERAVAPAPAPAVSAAPLPREDVKEQPVATQATPAPVITKNETPVVTKAATPVVAAPKPAPKPEPVKKAEPAKPAAAASGNYKIQLGAYSSDVEARQTWSKITGKHGDVVKGSPIIVKADVNGKTFYRLRASGFASADAAKKACASLSGRGQACFFAGQ